MQYIALGGFVLIVLAFLMGPILEFQFPKGVYRVLLASGFLFLISFVLGLVATQTRDALAIQVFGIIGNVVGAFGMLLVLIAAARFSTNSGGDPS